MYDRTQEAIPSEQSSRYVLQVIADSSELSRKFFIFVSFLDDVRAQLPQILAADTECGHGHGSALFPVSAILATLVVS